MTLVIWTEKGELMHTALDVYVFFLQPHFVVGCEDKTTDE